MPLNLKKDDMGDVIKDFYKSKAPQFKGKSKEKRREMAVAAKLTAERGPLPEESKRRCPVGKYYCFTDKKCKQIPKGFKMVGRAGYLRKENGHSVDDTKNGNGNGGNGNGNGNGGNGNGGNGNGNGGGMGEAINYSDTKLMKKYADEKKRHKEQDRRMKFGKFYDKASEARGRLKPGEVKRYDKKLGRYVSNKE